MHLGLIGFGRLGRLLTRYLAQDFHVHVYDLNLNPAEVSALGATPSTLEEACAQPIVLPLVPMSAFESLMQQIAGLLKPDSLIVDACSVKTLPVEWMLKHLPDSVSILGSHPMFGPDSAAETLFGAKLVLCPVRVEPKRYQEIKLYLEKHGIKLIETTPEEHDKQISKSLFLAHFLGRTLLEFGAHPLEIDTKGYRRLMKILLTVENDSLQLFEDMYHFNPYAAETRQKFIQAMDQVVERLDT
ncbi:prephenate dehydrogenase/arogenate dehydrogenase family protein [bacterium (Candidatus Blackallbacteria) CG17_big_fil_post_rev_8_21_14_2_50_48_46]|uniref:Prephenate dehydrogenase/arogenate dehydrogenase family protein n=1 Tax=bacterium (Candidatus Blackallbacteria) CG17_big_fil_post_rev_8_21_14_2_50_48_46 TaxID=2014261 RepID=A0A2M7FZZ8_9BACT|nr:MAG: prephenate dehydrogenase [bacterium (Candidatus Blackallbacteria) CG18_big_fil_WC_8_21_14_2_50_49_26]PIW15002.1 MAG: prephenate dehydrogenase/arogenate dehydrogenase family protein [bacterium (Candidatus Blackallbacteria) CG17_big_fil_post_rev_8_21_14_2_50_48_46]PIW50083.1 MAG: prephenate dehydrogenase/arogenate dehydrogenase family protein [bacterium (Candidatus Blackallbacteria) CG13_big_fil_rev_8_21_14_2_50_49_14]